MGFFPLRSEDLEADEWSQNASLRWKCSPPSMSGTSTSTKLSCNVSLPPKIELRIRCEKPSKEWKQWREVWDAYGEVTELRNKTSRLRGVATFVTCIGKEPRSPQWPSVSKRWRKSRHKQNAGVMGKPLHRGTNIMYERYKFNNRSK